jgi:hypothetical protein
MNISSILNSNIWLECQISVEQIMQYVSIDRKGRNRYKLTIFTNKNIIVLRNVGIFRCDHLPISIYSENYRKTNLPMVINLVTFYCNEIIWSEVDELEIDNSVNIPSDLIILSIIGYASMKMNHIHNDNKYSFLSLFPFEEVSLSEISENISSLIPLGTFSGLIKYASNSADQEESFRLYTYVDTTNGVSVEDIIQPNAMKGKFGTNYHIPTLQCSMQNVPCVIYMTYPYSYHNKETMSREEIYRLLPKSLVEKVTNLPNFKIKRHEKRGLISSFLHINLSYYDEEIRDNISYNLQLNNYKLVRVNQSIVNFFYSYLPEHCEV